MTKIKLKNKINKADANKPVTMKMLAEFTEDNLLPAVEDIVGYKVDEKLGKFRNTERDYYDRKMYELKGELRSEIIDVKGELKSEISDVKSELKSEIKGVKNELKKIRSGFKNEKERDYKFKTMLLNILKRHRLAKPQDFQMMTALAN